MVDGRGAWGCAVDAHVCRAAAGGAVHGDAGCALAPIGNMLSMKCLLMTAIGPKADFAKEEDPCLSN